MDWKFNETMSFLVPHLQPKRSGTSIAPFGEFSVASFALICRFFCRTRRTWVVVPAKEDMSAAAASTCGSEELSSCTTEPQRPPSSPSQPAPVGGRGRPQRCQSPREGASPGRETGKRATAAPDVDERQEPPPKVESELDECYHFALSLVPLLRRFSHSKRQHAKIGILNLLSNLEGGAFT